MLVSLALSFEYFLEKCIQQLQFYDYEPVQILTLDFLHGHLTFQSSESRYSNVFIKGL